MHEGLIKKLIASIKCSACGQHYEEGNIDVIEHNEELWFLKAVCSSCHVKSMVAAIIREEKAEVVTDLTEVELDKFKSADAVRADDLLDMHNFLRNFNGDVPRLFRQE